MVRQMEDLSDKLKFAEVNTNAEVIALRNQLESSRQQIAALQQIQNDTKRTENEFRNANLARMNILEKENAALKRQIDDMRNMSMGNNDTVLQEVHMLRNRIREIESSPQTNIANMQEA